MLFYFTGEALRRWALSNILLVMKMTSLILLVTCLHVSAAGFSQKVTLSVKEAPIAEVFTKIFRQTGISFVYNTNIFKDFGPVTLKVKDITISEVMDKCLNGHPFVYSITGNLIIIKPKPAVVLQPVDSLRTPVMDVKGRVTDKKGDPVAGATITVKGSRKSTVTDTNGAFTLTGVPEDAVMMISSVGYETANVSLNRQRVIHVVLEIKVSDLDQTVVIGYGTTTQRKNTGSVSKVSSETIAQQPVSNPLQALIGRMPGVLVTQSSGMPGSQVNIQIRGVNSISAGSNPLYVVDGIPFTPRALEISAINPDLLPSLFNSINPADIQSIEILKDADATAIYGSRGANGVILITTKKAQAGRTQLNINVYTGVGKLTRMPAMLNTQQYLQLRREAFANDGITPTIANAPDLLLWDTTRHTNFPEMVINNTARTTDAQVSLSGGNQTTRLLLSANYHRETPALIGDFADTRMAFHFNAEHSINQKLYVSLSANYSIEKNKLSTIRWEGLYNLRPHQQIYDSSGKIYWSPGSNLHPIANLLKLYQNDINNLVSNLQLRYTLRPGLQLKTNLGYSTTSMDRLETSPKASFNPANAILRSAIYQHAVNRSYIIEPQIDYTTTIAQGTFTALLGASWQQSPQESTLIQGFDHPTDALLNNPASARTVFTAYGNNDYRYNAVFGRLHYDWKGKYIVKLDARRDASSRFGPGNQFGNFGAVGAAWIFSQEQWMRTWLPFLSYGKFRASYGVTGNDQIADYGYRATWNTIANSPYGSIIPLRPTRIANPDYSWETTRKLETALELGLIKDRILFTMAWYRNRSDNQLVNYPLPGQTGFASYQTNLPALVENSGWEFELNTTNIKNTHFTWKTTFHVSVTRNKLLEYPGLSSSAFLSSWKVGEPISGLFRGYHFLGIDPQTGLAQFEDTNKDGIISSEDYVFGPNTWPKYFGGVGNNVSYKGFQFDLFIQFVRSNGRNDIKYNLYGSDIPGITSNQFVHIAEQVWRRPGDQAQLPRATTSTATQAGTNYSRYRVSDALLEDASFIRLKTLSLSWTLPARFYPGRSITNARLYVQGQNLLTITRYKGLDPETGAGIKGDENIFLPPVRFITAGCSIQF